MNSTVNDQRLLAKRRRKRILILEIFTVALVLLSLEVYCNFLGTLAGIAQGLGRDRAAETLYGQALFVQWKVRGSNSPAVSELLDKIAYFYYDTDRSDKAIPVVERSLAICKANYGTQSPNYAWTLSLKSLIYQGNGNYHEAETMAREALPTLETAYGRQSWAVSTTFNRLGLALDGERRFAEAEASFLQALTIREALYGPKSYTLVPILHNLASACSGDGKEEESNAARRRADNISARR